MGMLVGRILRVGYDLRPIDCVIHVRNRRCGFHILAHDGYFHLPVRYHYVDAVLFHHSTLRGFLACCISHVRALRQTWTGEGDFDCDLAD